MRAVWSFWTKPIRVGHRAVWPSSKHHLLGWVLSTRTGKVHYRPTALYTDDAGARALIDGVGLEFDEVHTTLNALADHDPDWWALGKLYAYRAQSAPFVHIDCDVFLWKRLREGLESAPVFAQNPEYFMPGRSYYRPEVFESAVNEVWDGWLPPEWHWYRHSGLPLRGESCGIVGGNRVDFLRHYAERAITLIEHPGNQAAWDRIGDKTNHSILFENTFSRPALNITGTTLTRHITTSRSITSSRRKDMPSIRTPLRRPVTPTSLRVPSGIHRWLTP